MFCVLCGACSVCVFCVFVCKSCLFVCMFECAGVFCLSVRMVVSPRSKVEDELKSLA